MPNKQEILDRALVIATERGMDAHQSSLIDNQMGFEALLPHALRLAMKTAIEKGDSMQDFVQAIPITFTAGVGTFPENILKSSLDDAFIVGRKYTTFFESLADMQRENYPNMIDYFALNGNQAHYQQNGTAFGGTVSISAVATPTLPNDSTTNINISNALTENWIEALVGLMTGEITMREALEA